MKLFVYGTLKMGHGNNRLLEHAEYLGDSTIPGYRLCYAHGPGSFPFAIPSENEKIKGEIWDIKDDEDTLRRIDNLEGHPNWYERTEEKTTNGHDVNLYVMNREKDNLVPCPINTKQEYVWDR